MKTFSTSCLVLLFSATFLSGVNIRIDYSLDTNGFFGDPTNDNDGFKERRDAIEAVAEFFSEILTDNLLAIDPAEFTDVTWTPRLFHPGTGALFNLPTDMVIPEDEIIIYVGGRALGGAGIGGPGAFTNTSDISPWIDIVRGRGQANASSANAADNTDFGPWGGSIAFSTTLNWNFSLTENLSGFEFVSTAIHEVCHVLGIGSANSWENLITSSEISTEATVTLKTLAQS